MKRFKMFILPFILASFLVLIACSYPKTANASDTKAARARTEEKVSMNKNMTTKYSIKRMYIRRDGKRIYGQLYTPDIKNRKLPLVILSHGFGGSYDNLTDYAQTFARQGVMAFVYDFVGGGPNSRSGGSMRKMSVLTEASDLEDVMDYFKTDKDVNHNKVFLEGASRGGFVSTYVAGQRPTEVAGLVLIYPAYVLQDQSKQRNPHPSTGPATSRLMGMTIGRIYDRDAQSFNIYDSMKKYPGNVLIIHGSADSIAPISYSRRAAQTFPHAKLVVVKGGQHGLYSKGWRLSIRDSLRFVINNL